jgi:methyl-accepting chemotaxis protein
MLGLSREDRRNRAQLAALNRSQAIIEFDLDGYILTANQIFRDITGYEVNELAGQHYSVLTAQATPEVHGIPRFWRGLQQGRPYSTTLGFYARNGNRLWFAITFAPMLGLAGQPVAIVAFATDVTADHEVCANARGEIAALNRSQAMIEFDMEGLILTANANFLSMFDYRLEDIQGRHHSIFVDPIERNAQPYRLFWENLRRGNYASAAFRRLTKGGHSVWIQASYNPVFDAEGKPYKIVKFASDITRAREEAADHEAQMLALDRSTAIIQFAPDGIILNANANFLKVMGYELSLVQGRHHSIFMPPGDAETPAYADFWRTLREGRYVASTFRRQHRDGSIVWLQASYNPVMAPDGSVQKVVKFATDVTRQVTVDAAMSAAAITLRLPA